MKTNIWDKLSSRYDTNSLKRFEIAYKKTIKYTKKYIKKDDSILDFGCGTGITTLEIAPEVKNILAIDTSQKMLEIARTKAIEKNIDNIKFMNADLYNDNIIKSNSFDAVCAFNILLYLQNDKEAIKRIKYVIRDNGYLFLATDCIGERSSVFVGVIKILQKLKLFPFMKFYTAKQIDNILIEYGFKIIEKEKVDKKASNYLIIAKKCK